MTTLTDRLKQGKDARKKCSRSSQAALGKSDALADALYKYALGYTEQNERDFAQFQQVCRKDHLRARSEANFAARIICRSCVASSGTVL